MWPLNPLGLESLRRLESTLITYCVMRNMYVLACVMRNMHIIVHVCIHACIHGCHRWRYVLPSMRNMYVLACVMRSMYIIVQHASCSFQASGPSVICATSSHRRYTSVPNGQGDVKVPNYWLEPTQTFAGNVSAVQPAHGFDAAVRCFPAEASSGVPSADENTFSWKS